MSRGMGKRDTGVGVAGPRVAVSVNFLAGPVRRGLRRG